MIKPRRDNPIPSTEHIPGANPEPGSEAPDQVRRLVDIMARLRSEQGCPWDREQTHRSLRECLVEETAELCDAIDADNQDNMAEELGDLLLQVVFHCQIAAENQQFDLQEVARRICDKLIRRHPHVFAGRKLGTADQVLRQWDQIKRSERPRRQQSRLHGVPRSLPALHRAHNIQRKAAKVGFDWPDIDGVIAKIEEELAEVREALTKADDQAVGEEIGDLLFAVVNLSRYRRHLAEDLLHSTVEKFRKRFEIVEDKLAARGKVPEDCSLQELENLWQQAKVGIN